MNDFFDLEFVINVSFSLFITAVSIISGFRFYITILMAITWGYFLVINSLKYIDYVITEKFNISNDNENPIKEH